MDGSPFYDLNAKASGGTVLSSGFMGALGRQRVVSSSGRGGLVPATRHGRRSMVELGGVAKGAASDGSFGRRPLQRPVSIPPVITREDKRE